MHGYEVTSCRAPKATVNVSLTTSDSTKTMSAGTAFNTTVDGTSYQFVTISDVTSANSGNVVNFDSTEIYEGTYVTTKYFFVLNPDMQKIDDNLINVFCESAKELNDNFGALGPRFENVSEKSHKQSNINKKYGQIDSISGSAMFFCTKIFDKNEGFDENFFLYFEETDYCYRSNKNNYKIYQVNSQRVQHDIGTSVETTSEDEANKLKDLYTWHFIWSKFYFTKKKKGYILSLFILAPILLRIIVKMIYYKGIGNTLQEKHYQIRLDGLLSSIKGQKSIKRP